MKISSVLMALLAACLILDGCASSMSSDSYTRGQARKESTVKNGTVESVRPVTIEGTKTPIGAVAGGAAGGVAGSSIGSGKGSVIAGILTGVAGGLVGSAAEEAVTRQQGLEIIVKLDSGATVAVTQKADKEFIPGERVHVISGGGSSRVTHIE
ncbi:MAG TPA: glycine zipper 2TM domain-containing protein [Burkholderiales bacterium]|nr:glycine zipper 2TM domain-containing protein [Burkholderiales bacterium]